MGDTGAGDFYAIDTEAAGAPVVVWMPGVAPEDAGPPERVAEDFGAFFLDRVQRAITD